MDEKFYTVEKPIHQKRPLEEDYARCRQLSECWNEIIRGVKDRAGCSEITFNLWLENLCLENVSDEYIFISTDKDDVRAIVYLERKFKSFFELLISEKVGESVIVRFLIRKI